MKRMIRASATPISELRKDIASLIERAKKLKTDASTDEQEGALKQCIYYLNQAEDSL